MRALLTSSIVVSGAYLAVIIFRSAFGMALPVVLKVGSIGLLLVLAAMSNPRRKLLIAALAFSTAGDFLLELKSLGSLGPTQLFLFGLISFLVAHLFYGALFVETKSQAAISASRKIACLIVVIVASCSLAILWPGLAEMRAPVCAYCIVLSAMAITAQLSRFPSLVAIGALSFLASDTMLALSIFGHPFAGSRALVWITYFAAQLMITVGVTSAQRRLFATA
jgi:uncharacterized membrane protein YhhN